VSFLTFTLVMCAAVFHATWNFVARRSKGNAGVFFWSWWVVVIVMLPVVISLPFTNFLSTSNVEGDPHQLFAMPQSVLCVVASGTIHAGYFLCLNFGYRIADMSLVYPISRGTGIVLTALWTRILLKEEISSLGWFGIMAVTFGVVLIGIPVTDLIRQLNEKRKNYSLVHSELTDIALEEIDNLVEDKPNIELEEKSMLPKPSTPAVKKVDVNWRGILFAVSVGIFISGYSVVDKWGVLFSNPILYIFIRGVVSQIVVTPFYLMEHMEEVKQSLHSHKGSILFIGPLSMVTYLTILYAFQFSNASYIVALREVSVVVGAAYGFVLLKEPFNKYKGIGIAAVLAGIICIKLA